MHHPANKGLGSMPVLTKAEIPEDLRAPGMPYVYVCTDMYRLRARGTVGR